jgi:hypothetical protein
MVCVRWNSIYVVFAIFLISAQSISDKVHAKGDKEDKPTGVVANTKPNNSLPDATYEFQWIEHRRLSWEDFQGPVRANNEESAAATHCGIGFRINGMTQAGKPDVTVYNTFYTKKSWVRHDAKINSILEHEQGHFDLCEIFTRKLRNRVGDISLNTPDIKESLLAIFSEVNNEYEICQQAYEDETTHGTNIHEQKRWMEKISKELNL